MCTLAFAVNSCNTHNSFNLNGIILGSVLTNPKLSVKRKFQRYTKIQEVYLILQKKGCLSMLEKGFKKNFGPDPNHKNVSFSGYVTDLVMCI